MPTTVRVWDLPTRLFHWALVACLIGLFTTAQLGSAAMVWHFQLGYLMLSLLLFRIVWGWLGGRWSRFASFLYTPAALVRFTRGQTTPEQTVGHSPLGALSVFVFLAVLLLQVTTGLMSDDEISNAGPLGRFVSGLVVNHATNYHKNIGKFMLLGLALLHVAAIFLYLFKKKENLIRPMLTGDKQLLQAMPAARDDAQTRLRALLLYTCCLGFVQGMVYFFA
jgi:cytochrome b